MKPYDNLDIAIIFTFCDTTLEVVEATEIFKDLSDEGEEINLDLVKRFSNKRIRKLVFDE